MQISPSKEVVFIIIKNSYPLSEPFILSKNSLVFTHDQYTSNSKPPRRNARWHLRKAGLNPDDRLTGTSGRLVLYVNVHDGLVGRHVFFAATASSLCRMCPSWAGATIHDAVLDHF